MDNIANSIWSFLSGFPLTPSSKAVAESWLSRSELSLVVFAFIIGIGLVFEDRAERRETSWIPPHPGWNWKRIFAWVVAVGVLAELFSDAAILVSSDALQAISDGEMARLENSTEVLKRENFSLQLSLERLKMPRTARLSGEKSQKLLKLLARHTKNTFWIITQTVDPDLSHTEQGLFSLQLSDIFSQAGWIKDSHWSQQDPTRADFPIEPVNEPGCHIAYSPNLGAVAFDISNVLKSAEIECAIGEDFTFRPNWLVIEIGLK